MNLTAPDRFIAPGAFFVEFWRRPENQRPINPVLEVSARFLCAADRSMLVRFKNLTLHHASDQRFHSIFSS